MDMKSWPPEWVAEYESVMAEVATEEVSATVRAHLLEDRLAAAGGAPWAAVVRRQALANGLLREVRTYARRSTKVRFVTAAGVVLEHASSVSVKRQGPNGETFEVLALFDTLTFEELHAKRAEYARSAEGFANSVEFTNRVLSLEALAPNALTPREAADQLGIDLDAFLRGEVAA